MKFTLKDDIIFVAVMVAITAAGSVIGTFISHGIANLFNG